MLFKRRLWFITYPCDVDGIEGIVSSGCEVQCTVFSGRFAVGQELEHEKSDNGNGGTDDDHHRSVFVFIR